MSHRLLMTAAIIWFQLNVSLQREPNFARYTDKYELAFFIGSRVQGNFQTARYACESRGSHLVKIDEQSITDAIKGDVTFSKKIGFWIGSSDIEEEGEWRWTDGTLVDVPGAYQNWANKEPNNKGNDEDCGCIGFWSYNASWADANCYKNFNYICQRDLPISVKSEDSVLTFHHISSIKSFQDALDACEADKARLVEIVKKTIYTKILSEASISKVFFWTAGNHLTGSWKWNSGERINSRLHYLNPSRWWSNTDNGECLEISSTGLNAISCASKRGFICEQIVVNNVKIEPEKLTIGETGTYEAKCSASGLPVPAVTWKKDQQEITETKGSSVYQIKGKGFAKLNADKAKLSEGGIYECWADNQVRGGAKHAQTHIEVSGMPVIEEIKAEPCSSGLLVRWRPSLRAVGFEHKVTATPVDDNHYPKVVQINPESATALSTTIDSLNAHSNYVVKIAACDNSACSPGHETSSEGWTGGIPNPVMSPKIEQQDQKSCLVSWLLPQNTLESVADGYMVRVLSTLANTRSQHPSSKVEEDVRTEKGKLSYAISTRPNRKYSVQIFAENCAENGEKVTAQGTCVTGSAAPSSLPPPEVSATVNEDGTRSMTIEIPPENNGLVSCIFVIMNFHKEESNHNFTLQDLDRVNGSHHGSTAHIALAIPMASLKSPTSNLEITIGDEKKTSCDLFETGLKTERKKRDVGAATRVYVGKNVKPKDGVEHSVMVVSSTPAEDDVYFQQSQEIRFSSSSGSWIVPVMIALALVLIAIVIIVIVMYKRRKSEKTTANELAGRNGENSNPDAVVYENFNANVPPVESTRTDIAMVDLAEIYSSMRRNANALFTEQFQNILQKSTSDMPSHQFASDPKLKNKNRYKNILPFDHSRVVIQGNETGYINACYIDGFKQKNKFIATQGPLPSTVDDFWLMAVEQNCGVIVALCKDVEAGKKKCEKYWPDRGLTMRFGSVRVENVEEVNFSTYVRRTLRVKRTSEVGESQMIISHYQFLVWPDHGVPQTTSNLIRMHHAVMETQKALRTSTPMIVHCSAGAGRTGTFIGYDILLQESRARKRADFFSGVMNMRMQRVEMVQNFHQFILVHKLVLESYLFGDTECSTDRIEQRLQNMASNRSDAAEEFRNLSKIDPVKNATSVGHRQNNKSMNMNQAIIPYDYSLVSLLQQSEEAASPYINASWIESYDEASPMIAAQGPLTSTILYFWRAILDNEVNTIVMLAQLKENNVEQCVQYWPTFPGEHVNFNNISVTLTEEHTEGSITVRKMEIRRQSAKKTVTQFQYHDWKSSQCPNDGHNVVELINKMQKNIRSVKHAVALVHCSDGAGRTGTFCAIVNLVDRLKLENHVDIFRAVKDLRDGRPGMVQTLDQYIFCHRVVVDYLKSFDLYSNF